MLLFSGVTNELAKTLSSDYICCCFTSRGHFVWVEKMRSFFSSSSSSSAINNQKLINAFIKVLTLPQKGFKTDGEITVFPRYLRAVKLLILLDLQKQKAHT